MFGIYAAVTRSLKCYFFILYHSLANEDQAYRYSVAPVTGAELVEVDCPIPINCESHQTA